ncbi:DNA repair protein RecO [Thermodesulfitimonas sp.]
MKFFQAEAVVLKSRPHKEADRIITLFSREYGKLRAVSYGSVRPTSRKRGAAQPFCRSRFYLVRGQEIHRIDQAELLERFPAIEQDLVLFGVAAYFAELVDAFTGEEVPNPKLYELLLRSLRLLGKARAMLLACAFKLRLLILTGFGPELGVCTLCRQTLPSGERSAFSPQTGGMLCPSCVGEGRTIEISPGTLKALRHLAAGPLEQVLTVKVAPVIERELSAILAETVAFHLGYRPQALSFLDQLSG